MTVIAPLAQRDFREQQIYTPLSGGQELITRSQTAARRSELKYLLEEHKYQKLRRAIRPFVEPDLFACSQVTSIYLDTDDNAMIRHSLEKPRYKEKLRLRAYLPSPNPQDACFLEIKKKVQGTVYKRRVEMTYAEALVFSRNGRLPEKSLDELADNDRRTVLQILQEIEWLFSQYGDLRPSFKLSCKRLSLKECGTDSLRITFDRDVEWSYLKGFESYDSLARPLMTADERIMEIKTTKGMPRWLIDVLNELEIYPQSFSKVGKSYQAWLQEGKG